MDAIKRNRDPQPEAGWTCHTATNGAGLQYPAIFATRIFQKHTSMYLKQRSNGQLEASEQQTNVRTISEQAQNSADTAS